MLDDPKVEISVIKSQLESIQKSINDVKESLNHMTEIRTSVAVMQQKHSSYAQDLEALETRVQEAEMRITNNSAYLNKMKGAVGLAITLVTLMQGAVVAGAAWLLSSVIDTREAVSTMQESLRYMEHEQARIIQLFLKSTEK
jgi:chromosome segregation ATPase